MADRVKLAQLDIPAVAGATWEEANDGDKVRRFVARNGGTLPGDIELEVTQYEPGAYLIVIWEQPNLPERTQ